MKPGFELSKELMDQIIFGMENQENRFFLDLNSLSLISMDEAEDMPDPDMSEEAASDLVELPPWQSVDGYNLMESFVTGLKNPLVRQELHRILQSGRGVFRQFKNCLKEHREIERLWFAHKDQHMKRRVLNWFNAIRESRGLEALQEEIFEADDLVLSDFELRRVTDSRDLETVEYLDRKAFSEILGAGGEAEYWHSFRRDHLPRAHESGEGSVVLGVYGPSGNLCAFLWALEESIRPGKTIGHILQLYVEPAFRGLGIAGMLLEAYLGRSRHELIGTVVFEAWNGASFLGRMIGRLGFSELTRSFVTGSGSLSGES